MIMGILGGMMMAWVAEADVTAAEKSAGYPFLLMAGIRIDPNAAASATAEPEISAKNMEATMLTMAKPPLMKPTRALQKLINLTERPAVFMSWPARMNSGMAINGKLSAPWKSLKGTESIPIPLAAMRITAVMARAKPMGTLINTITMTKRPIIYSILEIP
jgi:hypothetical protein